MCNVSNFVFLLTRITPITDLWRLSPLFRSPNQLTRLERYLIKDVMKDHVMKCFATGFISHFEYDAPDPWGHVENYKPVAGPKGEEVLRNKMKKEVLGGRMIGGPG